MSPVCYMQCRFLRVCYVPARRGAWGDKVWDSRSTGPCYSMGASHAVAPKGPVAKGLQII